MYLGNNITVKQHDTGIAELVFDVENSAVNIFNAQTVSELSEALTLLESSSTITGLLISSGKVGFIAGADITEFAPIFAQGAGKIVELLNKSNRNFNRIESLPFPVVVAINGFALGGGCEITLACDYRIASDDARIGLPETRLGIIPGWGGTVRLPRIAGIETAVEWIATGKEYPAKTALMMGVVDGVVAVERLHTAAMQTLQQCVENKLPYHARRQQKMTPLQHNSTERTMAFMTCKAMVVAQAGKHYPAPLAAVKGMGKAAGLGRDDALVIETEIFVSMAQTSVATSLSGIFVNDQLLTKKAKQLAKLADKKVAKAAVLGAGIMGGGIAYQSALKNIPIKMKDVQQAGLDLGLSEANKLLSKQVERGRLSVLEMGDVLNRIEPCLHYDGFDQIDIVVEAVVENPQVKGAVLAEVEQKVSKNTILASNTSTISIDLLAASLTRPENFCGMHFFNPVHAMPLVEVIKGNKTSDKTIAATVAYANAMGKKAIVVGDCPGFLVNRVLFPYFAGFLLLLRDGADFEQVDRVMEQWGWPMGPAYLLDVVGIDTAVHAAAVMAEGFPSRMQREFTSAADILFAEKRFGQKNTKGFYDYEKDKKGKLAKKVSVESVDLISPHVVVKNVSFSDEEIIFRMMIPMATELARCLEEDIVASAAEADMALIYGLGFPPFRGGLFRWLDDIGLASFCQYAKSYEYLGGLYQVTEGMQTLLAANKVYYATQIEQAGGQSHGDSF
jgi:3-hydroxyacyl-CoA dehydrogenase / enoyl-CoA hydratase / 3-hydroxybutyryl-CoA epimerase / enoyl-CoA isomerase